MGRQTDVATAARGLLVAGVVWLVYAVLWPFIFVQSSGEYVSRLSGATAIIADWQTPIHALVFLCLGALLALATLSWPDRNPRRDRWMLAGIVFLCLGLELAQVAVPDRHAAITDFLIDALAASAGFLATGRLLRRRPQWASRFAGPLVITTRGLAIALAVAIAALAITFHARTGLQNWDPACTLLLGNETTGQRPWRGQVAEWAIYDRPLEPDQLAQVQPVAAYDLRGSQTADLRAVGETIVDAVVRTDALTIDVTCATDDLEQSGPARIVTLSYGHHHRNFTVAQRGRELVFRLRTLTNGPNGTRLEPCWPDVFVDTAEHRHTLNYAAGQVRFFVDGQQRRPVVRLYDLRAQLAVQSAAGEIIAVIVLFLPLGALIRAGWSTRRRRTGVWLACGMLSPWLVVLVVAAMWAGHTVTWWSVLLAAVITLAGAVVPTAHSTERMQ